MQITKNFETSHQLCQNSAVIRISQDIKLAMTSAKDTAWTNLGVGNPLITPEVKHFWKDVVGSLDNELLTNNLCHYGDSMGLPSFRAAICDVFQNQLGWQITPENVLVTNGTQTLFYMLGSIFSEDKHAGKNKVLIPSLPEYVGYEALMANPEHIDAKLGVEKSIDDSTFRYQLDIDAIESGSSDYSGVLLSQPRNPSGCVLSAQEMAFLESFSQKRDIPLVIDSAYGNPFPALCFKPVSMSLQENMLYSFSLSKCGIPGSRIGIAIGDKYLIKALAHFQCNSSIQASIHGQMMAEKALNNMALLNLCEHQLQPLYRSKFDLAMSCMNAFFEQVQWQVHEYDGGMFLWVKFNHIGLSDCEIYKQAKKEQLIVIPGSMFFFGLIDAHNKLNNSSACIRISLAVENDALQGGLRTLSKIVKQLIEN
jgi:valine--pyruvate aminotransferase